MVIIKFDGLFVSVCLCVYIERYIKLLPDTLEQHDFINERRNNHR